MVPRAAIPAVLLTVIVAGCLGGPFMIPDPKEPLPEKPETLSERAVSNYTTTYEATKIYNRYVDDNPTKNQISCRSDTRVALESAFVVRVQCMGGVRVAGGILEGKTHADIVASADYYVSDTTTIRIDRDDWRRERYRGSGPDRTSFEVLNLANESTSMYVEFGRNGSETPLQLDYSLDPRSGVHQADLPFEYGTTRELRVRTDDATVTTQFTSEEIRIDTPTVVYVLPDGQVRVTVGPSNLMMENS